MKNQLCCCNHVNAASLKIHLDRLCRAVSFSVSFGVFSNTLRTAVMVEDVVRQNGAIPATVALLNGKLCIGLQFLLLLSISLVCLLFLNYSQDSKGKYLLSYIRFLCGELQSLITTLGKWHFFSLLKCFVTLTMHYFFYFFLCLLMLQLALLSLYYYYYKCR